MTPRPKRVTIKDVAARAGVSPSAVSIALNGKGASLPEKTRERIRAAADELDYRPDYSARAMVTGKTHIVGIVLPDISNPFFAQLVGQIQTALLEHNGTVTFLPVEMQRPATPADLSMQPDQTLLQTSVIQDGVILRGNLQRIGKDESWLARQLEKQGYKEAGEVFLAMADGNQVTVFPMESKREPADLADR